MSLSWSSLAVLNPLLDGSVLVLGVVSGEDLDSWHVLSLEDLVLLIEEGDGFLGGLIFIDNILDLVQECFVDLHIMMLFNHIGMSCWKTLYYNNPKCQINKN